MKNMSHDAVMLVLFLLFTSLCGKSQKKKCIIKNISLIVNKYKHSNAFTSEFQRSERQLSLATRNLACKEPSIQNRQL